MHTNFFISSNDTMNKQLDEQRYNQEMVVLDTTMFDRRNNLFLLLLLLHTYACHIQDSEMFWNQELCL